MTSPRAESPAIPGPHNRTTYLGAKIHPSRSLHLTSTNPDPRQHASPKVPSMPRRDRKGKCGYYTSRPHEGHRHTKTPLEMR